MKRIGMIFQPKRLEAVKYSRELAEILKKKNIQVWLGSAWEPDQLKALIKDTDLVISIGGDGTILRASKAIVPGLAPILGINLGNLGFMSELSLAEAGEKLPDVLDGKGWIENRAILEIYLKKKVMYALNDVFVGRRSLARLVTVECSLNKDKMTAYRADGIIITTASGSTGYNLASGGPILHPESRDMVLQPVSPHFSFNQSLVLPPETVIDLRVITSHEAMMSADGQVEEQLHSGDRLRVQLSKYQARFLRLKDRNYFYSSLESRLRRKTT
jgi:NAD+ kinase